MNKQQTDHATYLILQTKDFPSKGDPMRNSEVEKLRKQHTFLKFSLNKHSDNSID